MKKTIFTALLLAFSFASFADDNDGVGNKPLKDLICQKFSLFVQNLTNMVWVE